MICRSLRPAGSGLRHLFCFQPLRFISLHAVNCSDYTVFGRCALQDLQGRPLSKHCVRNLLKACDVRSGYIIALYAIALCGI